MQDQLFLDCPLAMLPFNVELTAELAVYFCSSLSKKDWKIKYSDTCVYSQYNFIHLITPDNFSYAFLTVLAAINDLTVVPQASELRC